MKLAYLDCAAGIAGDMCLAALLDMGLPLDYLKSQLSALGLDSEFDLQVVPTQRQGISAQQIVIHPTAVESSARHWSDIQQLISSSSLSPTVKQRSLDVFRNLGRAEAVVHQQPLERIHFHEVGAVDSLIDIVGTCIGMDWLQVDYLVCSPHPIGGGWVKTEHGQLPVPVPAVLQLWQDFRVPVFSNGIEAELVTPTGAALSVSFASSFGDCPPMRVTKVGVGAGSKDFAIPNVLRLWMGEGETSQPVETVTVLETQIDDLNPQVTAYTCELLLEAGALDVFSQAVTMKQGRPGTLVTTICPTHLADTCEGILFTETTTLGIRRSQQQRAVLERSFVPVTTPYGAASIKVARRYGQVVNAQPEFRDCIAIARQQGIPVQQVWLAAQLAWQQQSKG
jgi:hypothetical protein